MSAAAREPGGRHGRQTFMLRLPLLVVLLLVPLVWFGAAPAAACSCVTRSVPELIDAADAVVLGRLKSRDPDGDGQQVVYTFMGAERFKGDLSPGFEVHTASSSASCGLEGLVVGRSYVVFMDERNDVFVANLCGGTRRASDRFVDRVEAVTGGGLSFDFPRPGPEVPDEPSRSWVVAVVDRLGALWWD